MADALPRWFEPGRALVALDGGPLGRSWYYLDRFTEERRLSPNGAVSSYEETGETIAHREDDRITATVWRWTPST